MSSRAHPVDRPVLAPLMAGLLALGAVLTAARDADTALGRLAGAGAVVAGACFVVTFAVYWLGWLLREHERWREERERR